MERNDDRLAPHVEVWLDNLRGQFACELANHSIQSEHIIYESSPDAMRAMLRIAYLEGFKDRDKQINPPDIAADIAAVNAANEARTSRR